VLNRTPKNTYIFFTTVDFIEEITPPNSVVLFRKRKQTCASLFICNKEFHKWHKQKLLPAEEFDALLDFVSKRSYAMRNRMMILISFWSGMRVGEIASLRIEDVVDTAGKVKREIRLDAAQTKGRHARTVFFPAKLAAELQIYVDARAVQDRKQPFFMTAGGKAFTANVMTQHFFWLYRKAGYCSFVFK
jgi:integrase